MARVREGEGRLPSALSRRGCVPLPPYRPERIPRPGGNGIRRGSLEGYKDAQEDSGKSKLGTVAHWASANGCVDRKTYQKDKYMLTSAEKGEKKGFGAIISNRTDKAC